MFPAPLSAEVAYVTKNNIAVPNVNASASAIVALAAQRYNDEYSETGVTVTVPTAAVIIVKQ